MAEPAGRTLGDEEIEALTRVIRSGMLSSVWGAEVRALERDIAARTGAEHAVACSSGTAALHLAVAAVNPEPGDEIITTPISDFGTVAPILAQNAVPVFADVDPLTGNLDPESVRAKLTERTKAVISVHLFGSRAPLPGLGVPVIEDCAQAWGITEVQGAAGCFSFQQWKHITCGDGGVAVTDDPELARRMRLFADKGWPRDTGRHHISFGLNYRMTELAGAVARAQLAKLPAVLGCRRATAKSLIASIQDLPVHVPSDVDNHDWWLFPVVLTGGHRNTEVARALAAEGIPARAGYLAEGLHQAPALTTNPVYGSSRFPLEGRDACGPLPNAERLITETLVVVDWNEHYTPDHVERIATALRRVLT
jgi:dTDP-4-amino-4,6-dideoxygalactose transaminase